MPPEPYLFDLNATAFGMLLNSRRRGIPRCARCNATARKAYLGRSVVSIELDLRPQGHGAIRGFGLKLRCRCCGARSMVRSETAPTAEQQLAALRIYMSTVGEVQEIAGRARGARPPASSGMPVAGDGPVGDGTPGSAGAPLDAGAPGTRVVPSRRDPSAPPIGVDELIEVVTAIRAAKTWGEVMRVLGVG